MDFWIGSMKITNARNIEWKDNFDGTGQFWFNSVLVDKEGNEHDARFHLFRVTIPGIPYLEPNEDGKMFEVTCEDSEF